MRNIRLLAGACFSAAALILAPALPANAVSMQGSIPDTCSDYATASANNWGRDYVQPAGVFEQAGSGTVLVIASGKKYLVPAHQTPGTLAPAPVGQRIAEYQTIQNEEFTRCLFGMPVNAGTLK